MAQPLYFLPGLDTSALVVNGKLSRDVLRERGIADVFADVITCPGDGGASNISKGPDNRSGCILYYGRGSDGNAPQLSGYHPHGQTWHRINDGLYIGLANDSPPTPEDMRRKKQIPGIAWELNGADWLIPIIRRYDGSTELPRAMVWGADGAIQEPVRAEYMDRWEKASEIADWLFAGTWRDEYKGRALAYCVEMGLGINYRFGRNEQNLLRVIDVESFLVVLAALVDYHRSMRMVDAQKKRASSLNVASFTHGQQEDLTATSPATATSMP